MLVDNPRQFFMSLCKLKDRDFTAEEYKPVLESLTKKGKIHSKTRDTYFYTASIFNLIEKISSKSRRYRVTPVCRKICEVLGGKSKKHLYQKYLKALLLTNKTKGDFFKKFLEFTSTPKPIQEIKEVFGKFPSKTLIAFCVEAGLSVEYRGLVKSTEIKSIVSVEEFYSSLLKTYYDVQARSSRPIKMIYVPIDLLRDMVCLDLGLESYNLFDLMLKQVLNSNLGDSVYLHGAPPQVEEDYSGFSYKNRKYVYLSIRTEKYSEVNI